MTVMERPARVRWDLMVAGLFGGLAALVLRRWVDRG